MRYVAHIARREWVSILFSPTGLVLVTLYVGLAGYLFSLHISVSQQATLRHTCSSLGMLTVFMVPLITMRLLAEELRTGTFEVLIAHPVTDLQIVLGKFLAGLIVFSVMLAPTLLYLPMLAFLGSPDWGQSISCFLGQLLLGAMLLALGLLISGLTHSQVLAAMGAMVGGVLLILANTASHNFRGWLGDALAYLAMMEHFSTFRRGVIDTRSVVYFLATMGMFLYLAVRAVESRRWKFGAVAGGVPREWNSPRLCIGLVCTALLMLGEVVFSTVSRGFWSLGNSVLLGLGLAALVLPVWWNRVRLRYEFGRRRAGVAVFVLINSLLVVIIWTLTTFVSSRQYVRMDLTSSKRYALSELTLNTLDELSTPIQINTVMTGPTDLRQEIRDLLAEYGARSSALAIRHINPVRQPAEIEGLRERFNLTSEVANEVLVSSGENLRRIPITSMVNRTRQRLADGRVRYGPAQFVGEAELTSAIVQLTRESPGRVTFLIGHGERDIENARPDGLSSVSSELQRNGWQVDKRVIASGSEAAFNPDTSVVVIAGPKQPLAAGELRAIQGVLDRGGGVLALLEPGVDSGLVPLLNQWDVRLGNNIVVDLKEHVASADVSSLYVTRFREEHAIGKAMGNLAVVLPGARRIAVASTNPNVFTLNFMHGSRDSWAIEYEPGRRLQLDRNRDRRGPISLGIACERFEAFAEPGRAPLHGRLVVIGDSDFASNRYVELSGNLNLFLNSIEWLAGRQDLVAVRPRVADVRRFAMTAGQSKWLFRVAVLLMPGLLLLGGGTAIIRRRSRS